MICKKPYMLGVVPVPCSTCKFCRINRIRVWTHRMVLESYMHENNCFLTLTYDEENVPEDGCLEPRDYKLFLKKLRKYIAPEKIRYYVAGS